MWVVAYDPTDSKAVLSADQMDFWAFRHGSPFYSGREGPRVPAVWIPSNEVPALKKLGTSADLYLINVEGPNLRAHVKEPGQGQELWEAAEQATLENVLLALEHTYNMDFGTNTIARLGNLEPASMHGIPTFLAVPDSSRALRETERVGNMGVRQREITSRCAEACEVLVRDNKAVTHAAVAKTVRLGRGAHETNEMSWKLQLAMAILEDTNDCPAGLIILPETAVYFPDQWKMAGCQLGPTWEVLDAAVEAWKRTRTRLSRSAQVVRNLRIKGDAHLETQPPPTRGGPRSRNPEWDSICARDGFPIQSKWKVASPVSSDPAEYYPLISPELSEVLEIRGVGTFDEWLDLRRSARTGRGSILNASRLARRRTRAYGSLKKQSVPAELLKRKTIVTNHVKDHTARDGVEIHQNVSGERTYLGRVQLMDLVNLRSSMARPGRPRAVSPDGKGRDHVLACDLPISSEDFFGERATNARLRGWFSVADLLALEDGVYLGGPWTDDKVKLA